MLELLKLIFGGLVFFVVIVVAISFIQSDSIIRTTPGGDTGWKYSGRSWAKSPDTVEAVVIGTAKKGTEAGVILASFNAG